MEDRYEQLLCGLVREYIRTAEPVGSGVLPEILGWRVSPATIRNMLRVLEDEGYVHQPHTSAGRIPTDKGYRVYVNSLVVRDMKAEQIRRMARQFQHLQDTYDTANRSAAKLLSEMAKSVAITGRYPGHDFVDFGLSLLLDRPEDVNVNAVKEASLLLDTIDEVVDQFVREESQVQVYIGEENPAIKAEHTSIIARTTTLPDGQKVILMVVGPKRMPYEKQMSLINGMAQILEHSNNI